MKAAVFYGPGDLRIEERPRPAPKDEELLIEVAACAICGSDVRIYRSGVSRITRPVITGHEVAGTIAEVGRAVSGWRPGERVAVAPAIPCCDCAYCRRGVPTMCDRLQIIGYEFDGGFAEYMIVPASALRAGCVNRIPVGLSFCEAALAEPLACAINAQELLAVGLDDTVAILGAGPLGLMHAELAKARGARQVMLVEVRRARLEAARRLWPGVVIDGSGEDVVARIFEETDGVGASVVIVAAPSGEAQAQALMVAAKRGRISFFGGLPPANQVASLNTNLIHYRELHVVGAYGSEPRHNRIALELLASRRIDAGRLIERVVRLDSLHEGLAAASEGGVLKVLVKPRG